MSRRVLAAAVVGAAVLGAVPAAPASAEPCSLTCMVQNALTCQKVYDPVNEVPHTICPDDYLPL